MEVILQEDIPNLGKAGEVVQVRDGYARNFLLPRKKAVAADPSNLQMLAHQRRQATARQAKLHAAAEAVAQQLATIRVAFAREAGPEGKLFGAVTAIDIAEGLQAQAIAIDRRQIKLTEPLKHVGEYPVEVRIHADVMATVTVTVSAK